MNKGGFVTGIKIAHFIVDEKFPDSAYELFESVAPGCNVFFIASRPKTLKHIKKIPVIFISTSSFRNSSFLKELKQYDFVVLHSLSNFNQKLVLNCNNSEIKFLWVGMGYDYYDLIFDSRDLLYLPETKQIASNYINKKSKLNIRNILKKIIKKLFYKSLCKKDIIKKIHFFSPVLESEYPLVKNKCDKPFPAYLAWNYAANSKLLDDSIRYNYRVHGKDILLGNSASLTNNHIEMIDFLSGIDLSGEKIICPLSYGDQNYARDVIKYGEKKLKQNFYPLIDFMEYDQYIDLISRCTNVLMNHVRQQAVGNILAMLSKGAKIFLREENQLYNHFVKLGVKVFTIQQLLAKPSLLDVPLSNDEVVRNRGILKEHFGMDAALEKTRKLIEKITALP